MNNLDMLARVWTVLFLTSVGSLILYQLYRLAQEISKARRLREEQERWWARFKDNLK